MAQKTKIKKKKWFQIVAPAIFKEAVLGETLLEDPESMVGRRISQNLMSLTGDMKKQQVNIRFLITKVQNNRGITEIIGYNLMPSSVRRLVRRRSEKMDLSFVCFTADNKRIRIKPLIVTKTLATNSVVTAIRGLAIDTLTRAIRKMSYEVLLNELIYHKLQKGLSERLRKIFPLKICEIRYMGLEKGEGPADASGEAMPVQAAEAEQEPHQMEKAMEEGKSAESSAEAIQEEQA